MQQHCGLHEGVSGCRTASICAPIRAFKRGTLSKYMSSVQGEQRLEGLKLRPLSAFPSTHVGPLNFMFERCCKAALLNMHLAQYREKYDGVGHQ
jgi:hypothetical protein